MSSDPWHDWTGAAMYAGFVRQGTLYRALNERLASEAGLESAGRVLDLACGSGATARACLARLPKEAELVGVDGSPAMVELARSEVGDPRARFVVAAAAAVDEVVGGPFDRVVCNAAFWQFPAQREVLATVARLLAPGGRFVFNVPAERVEGAPAPVHSLQAALARAVESATGHPPPSSPASVDPTILEADLEEHGLELAGRSRFDQQTTQAELLELLRLPVMIGRVLPGVAPAERQRLLDEVADRVRLDLPVVVPWELFVVEKPSAEA